ncbi:XRE family transcriptional regulator [Vibrio owensii]|uniref:S24 family peptidase n=1 Tax=Vibrio owensii TaxID=696485 RepID=UPI0010486773|nr:LexA family transcriptional regulator [Vibrio owensii]TDE19251.1 XRE family transcriptional regulator [Vibrio owensii]
MKLHDILKNERLSRPFSLEEAANTFSEWGIDCSPSTLSRVERGAIPSFPIVDGYCKLFGWSLAELERKLGRSTSELDTESDTIQNRKRVPQAIGRYIPIVSWVQAGLWSESPSIDDHEQDQVFVTGNKLPKHTFALRVSGTSMEDCAGKHHFPDGSLILVNPDASAHDNDFVVAIDEATQEATFKQLINDCGIKYFKPLNSQFPVMKVTKTTMIKGVVFRVIDDRKL